MAKPTAPPRITFDAWWSPEENQVGVYRNVRSGVCGPAEIGEAASLDEAVTWLFGKGYLPAADWIQDCSYADTWSCREITPMCGQDA